MTGLREQCRLLVYDPILAAGHLGAVAVVHHEHAERGVRGHCGSSVLYRSASGRR